MDNSELLSQVNEIFIKTLNNESIQLTTESQATDIEEWDSLNHIMLVVAIEKHFNIRFGSQEIQSWNKVGDMLNSISEKIK